MDPLSLTASIIAIVTALHSAAQGFEKILSIREAPEQLVQVYNELSEVKVLVSIIKDIAQKPNVTDEETIFRFNRLMNRATDLLTQLADSTRRVVKDPECLSNDSKKVEVRWTGWYKEEKKIRRLAARLSEIRQSVASALTALSAVELPNIRIGLVEVSSRVRETHDRVRNLDAKIDERFNMLSAVLALQNIHHGTKAPTSVLPSVSTSFKGTRSDSIRENLQESDGDRGSDLRVEAVLVQYKPRIEVCRCNCHQFLAMKTPQWLGAAIGTWMIRYSGDLKSCTKCVHKLCQSGSQYMLKTAFYFPGWLLRRMICVQYKWSPLNGHSLSLRTPRLVSSNSNVFLYAQHNNIEGMQRLFQHNLASPLDISFEEGRTPLHFAVTAFTADRPEMVRFLLAQGSDPQLEDHNMITPHDVVWNYFLQNPGNVQMEELMHSAGLSPSEADSLEKREFTSVHRIVLGISKLKLDAYLEDDLSEIDKPDSLGKTPLCWAASRQDPEMVRILLKYGASLYIRDHRKQSPLHYAAGSGSPESMEQLLIASRKLAEIQESMPGEDSAMKVMSSLVDSRDCKGRTPLNFATRRDFPVHAQLLISYGADMECPDDIMSRTTLLYAIYWNSHTVLPILLNNGARTDVVDARNASVLHYAGRFGDLETLKILASHNLGVLDIDMKDDTGLTALDILNSTDARCRPQMGEMRTRAVGFFHEILGNATVGYFKQNIVVTVEESEEVVDIKCKDHEDRNNEDEGTDSDATEEFEDALSVFAPDLEDSVYDSKSPVRELQNLRLISS